jgi:hypothetical protein
VGKSAVQKQPQGRRKAKESCQQFAGRILSIYLFSGSSSCQAPTRANTRAGLPVPPTIGNGATMSAAPTGGSFAKFRSEVRRTCHFPTGSDGPGKDGFHADAQQRGFFADPLGALDRESGGVRVALPFDKDFPSGCGGTTPVTDYLS